LSSRTNGHRAAALALLLALGSAAAQPASGRYEGRLCVATGDDPASCGPAAVLVRGTKEVRVQIADIVYRLALHSSQLDVVLMHGAMQIDGFTANYEWEGRALVFTDPDKPVRYRLEIEP
jgi:hypothetical protein